MWRAYLAGLAASLCVLSLSAGEEGLRLSVYATAGDVQRYLAAADHRERVVEVCRSLQVSRIFLEGRRGDEYVAPTTLTEVRDFLARKGIHASGGIATVPGERFGTRQNAALGWLDWESDKTRRDIAGFFAANAPVFDELIVDDFFCTADTSPGSERARGVRSWGEYRRDLLVSLVESLIVQPTRSARSSARLLIKFPQWYDRFHLFGYDPPRMAAAFDQVWVGTEVRDPKTRRMGFVQPTEGYMNFRWLTSIAGDKVRGAWFDHIECSAQNFVDQAYLSVLAGARELTLFHLGDLMEGHPGDALLASRLPELQTAAERVRGQRREGVAFYKPPGSDADENLYLADYLGMIGLPILPEAHYPDSARVAVLAVQAAADPDVLSRMRRHLRGGATLVLTPAFIRRVGGAASELAGVKAGQASVPATTQEALIGRTRISLPMPLEVDAALKAVRSRAVVRVNVAGRSLPFLTSRQWGGGRVLVLNVRTFSEPDFREAQEWLLAPKRRGLSELPQELADPLRQRLLGPLGVQVNAPAGVALFLFGDGRCLYNFLDHPVGVRLEGEHLQLGANQLSWRAATRSSSQPRK